jgi:hypothetical protein
MLPGPGRLRWRAVYQVGLLAGFMAAWLVLGGAARAGASGMEVAGVRFPAQMQVAGRSLVLNGAGLRRILFMKVYAVGLYLPARSHMPAAILDRDGPRSMRVSLLREVSTEDNVDALLDGLNDNNSSTEMAAIQGEVTQFLSLLKTLHTVPEGTLIHMDYLPGTGTRLSVNGVPLGTIPGSAFNRALLKIWLGEDPIQTSLKHALLGLERG